MMMNTLYLKQLQQIKKKNIYIYILTDSRKSEMEVQLV